MKRRGRPPKFDRQEALSRAMMAFWANGYDGTSMADLGAVMGVNAPSIYAAFGSKESLFLEAVTLYRTTEGSRIWSAALAERTARDAVATMLRTSAEEFTQHGKPTGCLVILGALHADDQSELVCQQLKKYRAESASSLRSLFEQAVVAGELKAGTDVRTLAGFCMAVQQGMSIQARDGASRDSLLAVAECATKAWDSLMAG